MNRFRRGARMVLLFRRFTRRMTPAELAENVTLLHQSFIRRQLKLEQQAAGVSPERSKQGSSVSPSNPNNTEIRNTKSSKPSSAKSKLHVNQREASDQWKKTIGKVVAVKNFQTVVPDAILRAQAEKAQEMLNSQLPPAALQKGLSRRQSVSYDGDLSFYEDTALEKRAQLLEHPDLTAYVSEIWHELKTCDHPGIPGDKVLMEREYKAFHKIVTRALVPGVQEDELDDLAQTDWEGDTERLGIEIVVEVVKKRRGSVVGRASGATPTRRKSITKLTKVVLTETGFRRSILEMADLWTDSIDSKEYMDFLAVVSNVVRNAHEQEAQSNEKHKSTSASGGGGASPTFEHHRTPPPPLSPNTNTSTSSNNVFSPPPQLNSPTTTSGGGATSSPNPYNTSSPSTSLLSLSGSSIVYQEKGGSGHARNNSNSKKQHEARKQGTISPLLSQISPWETSEPSSAGTSAQALLPSPFNPKKSPSSSTNHNPTMIALPSIITPKRKSLFPMDFEQEGEVLEEGGSDIQIQLPGLIAKSPPPPHERDSIKKGKKNRKGERKKSSLSNEEEGSGVVRRRGSTHAELKDKLKARRGSSIHLVDMNLNLNSEGSGGDKESGSALNRNGSFRSEISYDSVSSSSSSVSSSDSASKNRGGEKNMLFGDSYHYPHHSKHTTFNRPSCYHGSSYQGKSERGRGGFKKEGRGGVGDGSCSAGYRQSFTTDTSSVFTNDHTYSSSQRNKSIKYSSRNGKKNKKILPPAVDPYAAMLHKLVQDTHGAPEVELKNLKHSLLS